MEQVGPFIPYNACPTVVQYRCILSAVRDISDIALNSQQCRSLKDDEVLRGRYVAHIVAVALEVRLHFTSGVCTFTTRRVPPPSPIIHSRQFLSDTFFFPSPLPICWTSERMASGCYKYRRAYH